MRIALLSYRSKEHCGGQGVYVRYLSGGLVALGHEVEVFSGQPYPEGLDPRVRLASSGGDEAVHAITPGTSREGNYVTSSARA